MSIQFVHVVINPAVGQDFPILHTLNTIALLVGICRIYLGAHFSSDVVAGAISGTALAEGYCRLLRIRPDADASERLPRDTPESDTDTAL